MKVRSVAYTAVPTVLSLVFGFAATVVVARTLPEADFGQYVFWVSIVTFSAQATDLAYPSFMEYYLPRRPERERLATASHGVVVPATASFVGGLVVAGFFLLTDRPTVAVLAVLAVMAISANKFLVALHHALKQFDRAAVVQSVHVVTKLALFVAIVVAYPTPIGVLAAFVASYVLASAVALVLIDGPWRTGDDEFDWRSHLAELRSFAPYEVAGRVLKEFSGSLPIWILVAVVGPYAAAYWQVLQQFRQLAFRLVDPIRTVFLPEMADVDAAGGDLRQFAEIYLKFCSVGILPLLVGSVVLHAPLVEGIFGEKYGSITYVLPVFLLAAYFGAISTIPYFLSKGRTRARLVLTVATDVVLGLGVYVGVVTLGFPGAALGLLAGTLVATAGTYGTMVVEVGPPRIEQMRLERVAVALLALLAGTYLSRQFVTGVPSLVVVVGALGLSYFALIVRLGVITPAEKSRLLAALPEGRVRRGLDQLIA